MDQIETRLHSPHKYLVNAAQPGVAYHEDAFMHQDADFTDVLGYGSKMYIFEAGGRKPTGFVLALYTQIRSQRQKNTYRKNSAIS